MTKSNLEIKNLPQLATSDCCNPIVHYQERLRVKIFFDVRDRFYCRFDELTAADGTSEIIGIINGERSSVVWK